MTTRGGELEGRARSWASTTGAWQASWWLLVRMSGDGVSDGFGEDDEQCNRALFTIAPFFFKTNFKNLKSNYVFLF